MQELLHYLLKQKAMKPKQSDNSITNHKTLPPPNNLLERNLKSSGLRPNHFKSAQQKRYSDIQTWKAVPPRKMEIIIYKTSKYLLSNINPTQIFKGLNTKSLEIQNRFCTFLKLEISS